MISKLAPEHFKKNLPKKLSPFLSIILRID